jgi:hypothetical protein
MGLSIFFLGVNIIQIGWKDRDRYFNLQRALLPHEKKLIKEYWRKIVFTIATGVVLLIIVYLLHRMGILFPVLRK